jgi:hypothetical protein
VSVLAQTTASKDDGVVVDAGERAALLAARVRQLVGIASYFLNFRR